MTAVTGGQTGRATQRYRDISVAGGDTATPRNMRKRLAVLADHLGPQHRRLIDCGCGEGDYVRALRSQLGLDVIGVEHCGDKVAAAHARDGSDDLVAQGDLERLEHPTASFDAALLNEVLEHVPDDGAALREVRRVLRPGGRLAVFSPNRWFPFESHGVNVRRSGRRLSPSTPFVPWVPVRLGRHVVDYWARNYWPHELRRLVRGAGFEIVATDFVWQTFENISGSQPALVRVARPALRTLSSWLEAAPGVRRLGVSQVLVADAVR